MKLAATPATTNCTRAERSDKFLISSAILRRKLRDVARSNSSSMMIIRVPATGASRSVTRSEEHTSELQSLMRISYAVFCLQKKKQYIQLVNGKYRQLMLNQKTNNYRTILRQ